MFKVTENGIEAGEIIELTDEDLETIQEMFCSYQNSDYLLKRDGVWKKPNRIVGDRT